MKCNVGTTDKIVRLVVALVFVYFGYAYSAWWYLVTLIAAGTALAGFCPAYTLFGMNTCKKKR